MRELERRAAYGDEEAQVALLVTRVRSGKFSNTKLELAAYLGHPLAEQAVGRHFKKASKHPRRWARGLARFGDRPCILTVLIAHRAALTGLPDIPDPVGYRRYRRNHRLFGEGEGLHESWRLALEAAERWAAGDKSAKREIFEHVEAYDQYRVTAPYWQRTNLICYLDTLATGKVAEAAEKSFMAATNYLSPSYSKWGKKHADKALRAEIARVLLPWTLNE